MVCVCVWKAFRLSGSPYSLSHTYNPPPRSHSHNPSTSNVDLPLCLPRHTNIYTHIHTRLIPSFGTPSGNEPPSPAITSKHTNQALSHIYFVDLISTVPTLFPFVMYITVIQEFNHIHLSICLSYSLLQQHVQRWGCQWQHHIKYSARNRVLYLVLCYWLLTLWFDAHTSQWDVVIAHFFYSSSFWTFTGHQVANLYVIIHSATHGMQVHS